MPHKNPRFIITSEEIAIAKVVDKYQQQGKSVYVTGLNPESQETLDKGFS
jgi:hypothetical protein